MHIPDLCERIDLGGNPFVGHQRVLSFFFNFQFGEIRVIRKNNWHTRGQTCCTWFNPYLWNSVHRDKAWFINSLHQSRGLSYSFPLLKINSARKTKNSSHNLHRTVSRIFNNECNLGDAFFIEFSVSRSFFLFVFFFSSSGGKFCRES